MGDEMFRGQLFRKVTRRVLKPLGGGSAPGGNQSAGRSRFTATGPGHVCGRKRKEPRRRGSSSSSGGSRLDRLLEVAAAAAAAAAGRAGVLRRRGGSSGQGRIPRQRAVVATTWAGVTACVGEGGMGKRQRPWPSAEVQASPSIRPRSVSQSVSQPANQPASARASVCVKARSQCRVDWLLLTRGGLIGREGQPRWRAPGLLQGSGGRWAVGGGDVRGGASSFGRGRVNVVMADSSFTMALWKAGRESGRSGTSMEAALAGWVLVLVLGRRWAGAGAGLVLGW